MTQTKDELDIKIYKDSIIKPSLIVISSDHHDFDLALKSPYTTIKDEENCQVEQFPELPPLNRTVTNLAVQTKSIQ